MESICPALTIFQKKSIEIKQIYFLKFWVLFSQSFFSGFGVFRYLLDFILVVVHCRHSGYQNGTQRWGPPSALVRELALMPLFESHQSRPCCKHNFVVSTPPSPLVPFGNLRAGF